ncbi:hypothetical protein WJX73_001453 [Symbiochloris irregularis]|uniref:phenylalanine--tRNA ligase n=1 Tax=Symbiochloris irregularis TaxID=706552 RepID=A0AAW1PTZ6_9CHLO
MPAATDVESQVLEALNAHGEIADTEAFSRSASPALDHQSVVGTLRSLEAAGMVSTEGTERTRLGLSSEAQDYLSNGSPESQLYNSVPEGGICMADLKAQLGSIADIGFRQAMQQKWIVIEKTETGQLVKRKVSEVQDKVAQQLQDVADGKTLAEAEVKDLRKRKLVMQTTHTVYHVTKGPNFSMQRRKAETDLTQEMLQRGTWREAEFKPYNFNALGVAPPSGHLHPLLKVRAAFRKIFTQMGFEEMPTNSFVESSFWNFDALFQPQQHPARDAHDTFFVTHPATTPLSTVPEDYRKRVQSIHERGGFGSKGYGSPWREGEAEKNLLRTHTTAVSSRMLYRLAQQGFKPAKYFSIDRVFRNEAIDRTHLAEFFQLEGVVCDYGLTLGHLIGVLSQFFERLGLSELRFKPAYNPYTEPSMEIFAYSKELKKWIEVGNSGMFRPEMLRPMGIPPGVNVIAWGLGLERPTMILYGINNIRELSGHKVSLNIVRQNPICRLGL